MILEKKLSNWLASCSRATAVLAVSPHRMKMGREAREAKAEAGLVAVALSDLLGAAERGRGRPRARVGVGRSVWADCGRSFFTGDRVSADSCLRGEQEEEASAPSESMPGSLTRWKAVSSGGV